MCTREPEGFKNAKGKDFWKLRGRKKYFFAEDISEDFSQKIQDITFTTDFRVFLDIFEIFAEDCFLLRSFRKFLPSEFLRLSRFHM